MCKQCIGILLLSLAITGLVIFFHPQPLPWSEDVLKEGEVRMQDVQAWGDPVLWVDARAEQDYEQGHIESAVLLNEDQWESLLPNLLELWEPGKKVVVYCSSRSCQRSKHVAERLRSEVGLDEVFVLHGGYDSVIN